MKKFKNAGRIALSVAALSLVTYVSEAQVGIGTMLPNEKLHVQDGSVLSISSELDPQSNPFYDPSSSDDDPVQYYMKWLHEKAAFRSGGKGIYSNAIEPANVGNFSFASGYEVKATGVGSSAFGLRSAASGIAAFANGQFAVASGNLSFAHGSFVDANGNGSVAMGSQVNNNYQNGSFIFGDGSGSAQNTANNQMMMRFSGGYRFFSNSNLTTGVYLAPGSNSWSVVSDAGTKENLATVDGDAFLEKIDGMNLTSWNYKGQDPKIFRHYGPMAQDFFKAFGKDEYGVIGTDTTINQADFDGVNLIAIQALIRRMKTINDDLQAEISTIRKELAEFRASDVSRSEHVSGK
jgi:hypothetical protein